MRRPVSDELTRFDASSTGLAGTEEDVGAAAAEVVDDDGGVTPTASTDETGAGAFTAVVALARWVVGGMTRAVEDAALDGLVTGGAALEEVAVAVEVSASPRGRWLTLGVTDGVQTDESVRSAGVESAAVVVGSVGVEVSVGSVAVGVSLTQTSVRGSARTLLCSAPAVLTALKMAKATAAARHS